MRLAARQGLNLSMQDALRKNLLDKKPDGMETSILLTLGDLNHRGAGIAHERRAVRHRHAQPLFQQRRAGHLFGLVDVAVPAAQACRKRFSAGQQQIRESKESGLAGCVQ